MSAAEQAVLGSLLLDASAWPQVASIVQADSFTRPDHRLIFRAIAALASAGTVTDALTVAELLKQTGHLQAAGGIEALSELARTTPSATNALAYARIVRERADCLRLKELAQESDGTELLEAAQRLLAARAALTAEPAIALRHIADVVAEHREAEWINGLDDVLERRVLAVIAGPRNTFKSFIADHWAMLAALKGESVVILNAEGAGLGRRVEAWMRYYAPAVELRTLRLLTLERAVNLNSAPVLESLRAAIDARALVPGLILIDTLSKYSPGMKENATEEMGAFLDALSRALRDHYGCTVLVVTHSGHADARRPRGSSTLMANPDCEFIVERPSPTTMTVTVTRERYKDSPPLPPLAYVAHVIDLGRTDRRGKPVSSLILLDMDAASVATARRPELRGKVQRQLLAALRAQSTNGAGIWTLADIREIGRKAGIANNRAREAAEALTFSAHLTASVGGWRLTQ